GRRPLVLPRAVRSPATRRDGRPADLHPRRVDDVRGAGTARARHPALLERAGELGGARLARGGPGVLDLILRSCRLPTGAEPVDLAIADGRIVSVGRADEAARETVDVAGRVVTPGLVEAHLHRATA